MNSSFSEIKDTRPHREFVKRASEELKKDDRILGLAIGGSWIEQAMDEYSDLDLIVVGDDASYAELFRDRFELTESLGSCLACFTGEHVGEPRLLIALYGNPLLHVDLKWVSLQDFGSRVEDPHVFWERESFLSRRIAETTPQWPMPDLQWMEDRFWIWIHYAALKIGRGEFFEVIGFLGFLREQVLGPLAWIKQGSRPRGVRRVESRLPQEAVFLRKTLAQESRSSCISAVEACAQHYLKLREQLAPAGLIRKEHAQNAALDFLRQLA